MKCSKCSNPLQDEANFCEECGQKVCKETIVRTTFCPNTIQNEARTSQPCGKDIREGKNFCFGCGWKISIDCFLPGAKMCSGMLQSGAPCDNIVTPSTNFCSGCGRPSGSEPPKPVASSAENVDANQHNMGGAQQGESIQNKTGDPPSGGCSNVEGQVDAENKDIESMSQIPHSASIVIDNSQQSGQNGCEKDKTSVDELNQKHPVISAHQNCSTSEQDEFKKHELKNVVSALGINDKIEDDILVPQIETPANTASMPVEALSDAQNANHECKVDDSDLESGQHSEQDSAGGQIKVEDLEDLDSDSNSDRDNQAETEASNPNTREKNKKKGKEKLNKENARKEKVKDVHGKENSSEPISNQKVLKSMEATEKDKEEIAKQGESSEVEGSARSSLPANTAPSSTTSGEKGSTGPSPQPKPTIHHILSEQGTNVDSPMTISGSSGYQNNQINNASTSGRTYADAASTGHTEVTRSTSETVEINFCAIASHKFLVNPSNSCVYMRFSAAELGGMYKFWPTVSSHLKISVDDFVAITATVKVPKKVLHDGELKYSYCVVVDGEPLDEYYYNYYSPSKVNDEGNKRELSHRDNISDVWWQYDGVLNPIPEKRLWQKLKDFTGFDGYEKRLESDISLSVKGFFPRWKHFFTEGVDCSPADVVDTIDMLYSGLKKSYFKAMKKWQSETDFKSVVGMAVLDVLLPKFEDLQKNKDIIGAIGVVFVSGYFDISLTQRAKNILFESLVLDGNSKDKKCPTYEKLKENYKGMIPKVKEALGKLINSMKSTDDPTWLCSLPLYHFLCGKLRPFEEIALNDAHNARRPLWWGKEEVIFEMDYLKGKSKWSVEPMAILKKLEPMFEMDFYLPRSFMSVLQLDKLEVVKSKALPPEVTLAGLYYFVNTERHFDEETKRKMMYACLEVVISQLREYCDKNAGEISKNMLSSAYLSVNIGGELVHVAYNKHERETGLMARTVKAYMVSLDAFEKMVMKDSEIAKNFSKKDFHLKSMYDKGKWITYWLQKKDFYYTVKEDLKLIQTCCWNEQIILASSQHALLVWTATIHEEVWDRILSIELSDGTAVRNVLLNELKSELLSTLDKKTSSRKEDLVEIYCSGAEEFSSTMQEILGKHAFQALEKGYMCEDGIVSGPGAPKYGSMLSELFERSWEKNQLSESKPRPILKFTLSWKPFVHFLEMFYQNEKSDVLTGDCQIHFAQAATLLKEMLNKLLTGTICIGDIEMINESVDSFLRTNSAIWRSEKRHDLNQTLVKETLVLRCKEVRKFQEIQRNVGVLVQMCQHFQVNLTDIDREMEELSHLDDKMLCEVCKPAIIEKVSDLEAYNPVVIAFKMSPDMEAVLVDLKWLSQGSLFLNMWTKQGRLEETKKGSPLTVDEVKENVWQSVNAAWFSLRKRIAIGDITFKEFQDHFRHVPVDNLKEQLEYLTVGKKDWIRERLRQFHQHRELEQCVTGAQVILKVVKEYDLKGNFEPIEMIMKMVQGTYLETKMNEFDTSLIDACDTLKGIGEEKIKSLEEFINCKQLIEWLRTSMQSLKELKVFVDLASISAGEGDLEVAKVKFLHAATTGYAPLIFNLDDQCDYSEFLEKCQHVWTELRTDPHLPNKLRETNRHLEWLNSVKSAQGSVEVTSMKQAEAINSVGIYMVGRIDTNLQKEKPQIDDVLQLHIQKDEKGSQLPKRYQYKELQELQSKLMLVAGKAEMGRDDVEKFTIVFDAVVRLCNVYIKLVSSGCVLFTNWQARFLCDPERKVCAFVKFGSGHECTQLKGRRNEKEDVSTTIPKLAKFMEVCLDEWLKYIDQKRDEYHHLNFFTVDQMVILQRELVMMGGEVEPSDFIYPLLSVVKHDCTKMELIGALKKAKGDVTQKEAEQEAEMAEQEEGEEIDTDDENQRKANAIEKFILTITYSGYPEKLARQALRKGISPDDIDEGIVWCMDHEDQTEMEEGVNEQQTGGSVVEDYEGWTKSELSISAMTQDILASLQYTRNNAAAADTLIPDLEQLWGEFLSSISSSVFDYLSVEHLGIILRRLSETETFTVNRPFLPCFEEGVPNLLLCPQDEILNTVLTIYSHDVNQPLPQSDEILMCTSHTTLDEVDIFWRRAVFDTTNRIYCLVNGDLLDYEVSDRGERRLEHHMQKAKENDIAYKLVVVCSIERENYSRIVVALDKYRRPPLPLMNHDNMVKYIKDKLTFDIKKPAETPAAEADFEHCTVRVVKSWRAGVGKTLHKKRLAEKIQGLHSGIVRRNKAVVSIPLHEREIDIDEIMSVLMENTLHPGKIEPRLFHIDLSHEVQEGVDYLLFQLLILGCLTNSTGHVWRKVPYDLYIVETMPLLARDFQEQRGYTKCMHRCLDILPDVTCRSPQEILKKYQGNAPDIGLNDLLFDNEELKSNVFQRPFQYLYRLDMNQGLGDVDMSRTEENPQTCLNTLLRHCGIRDPSWAELQHFVWFLNTQLADFENSAFISLTAAEDLPGFSKFVLRFLIQMSRDFATRSLYMSEESPIQMLQRMDIEGEEEEENEEEILRQFQLRRTWESSPHPYLFFNPDHHSMTFLGFNIERYSGNLIDIQTGRVLETGIMQQNLQNALTTNGVPINENFDSLPRDQKLIKLCSVMGLKDVSDPDPTYELTTDNVKKILAIYMRFRCDIPVIIMGETGCGKTRLIKFMCQLQCPIGVEVQNMILMKVHGGTRRCDIKKKLEEAERVAQENMAHYGQRLYTVLFFDEANTTEAIGLIKEIMCDRSIEGEPLRLCQTLKIVAACNPYRKHSEEVIKRLEQAGLGYHVDADKTCDRMGRVPMRRLVYRVQPLPQSMLPLVWDFGQLDTDVEEMYIKQMVLRCIRGGKLPDEPNLDTTVSHILSAAQEFMRGQRDECSFVSLRDVERALEVMSWFYAQSQGGLFDLMEEEKGTDSNEELELDDMEEEAIPKHQEDEENVIEDATEIQQGRSYHWKDWCIVRGRDYLYLWSDAAALELYNGSNGWFRFILDSKLATMYSSGNPADSSESSKNRGQFLEKLQRVRGQIKQGAVSQPIMSYVGSQRLMFGNWTLACTKEGELHIHNFDGQQESVENTILKEDLPGFIFESDRGTKHCFTAGTSLGPEFATGWGGNKTRKMRSKSEEIRFKGVSDLTKALVLALGVCYHACLKNREKFREEMVRQFRPPCVLPKGADQMLNIITSCQNVFLEIDNIGANIAKNQALKENVFMMVICIELRIPLFLVGKPGSSKSLAKTIVADAMQGNASHTGIYRNYKQVQMVSFQCSPLSVPEGIMGTFRQCAMYQKDKDLNRFVSVVVLDEVGLAEDSPRMPLKTLHPLLEDGCQGDEKPEEHKKVAFIGISNWALDPAKMNRGILVQTEVPDREELEESADGICSGNKRIKEMIKPLLKPLAESYLQVFDSVLAKREFFGLRDFYSLIKMVYSFAKKNHKKPTWLMLQHCIKRNFGGFKHSEDQDPLSVFSEKLKTVEKISKPSPGDPDCTPGGLIEACLKGDDVDSDTRYLLLLTENYGALSVLQQKILTMKNAITIFGSSFPSDQEYTQVCRNINRIKVCMETGNTVVLLNLENIYESLYDALNQYYVYFGGERYVDLGLGTHRVKCRVHKKFRLIVVAEKDIVYSKFPTPLINRLEKHFLNISTMLSAAQVRLAEKLEDWAQQFEISVPLFRYQRERVAEYKIGDVFMGFHADTCASIILHVCQKYSDDDLETIENEVMQNAKEILLWCATPDGVLRAKNRLRDFDFVENIYYEKQKHDNLLFYLDQMLRMEHSDGLYAQVTTSSKLITTADIADLSQYLNIPRPQISLLTLQSCDTEQQFCRQVKQSFESDLEAESLLIVQSESGNENASLVACAQYCVLDQLQQLEDKKTGKTHIVFIIHLPRMVGGRFTGFQCGKWHSVHIDDLRPDDDKMPSFIEMKNKSVGTLLGNASGSMRPRDADDMEWEDKAEQQEEAGEVKMTKDHDFGNLMEHTVQVQVQKKVNIPFFIKLTAHPALGMVKDPDGDSTRTTERVKILLELLNQETKEELTFINGVGRHLIALMKEKEETMGQSAEDWLYAEVTNRDCINRAGTFRKARNQCIIEKLSPILAGIITEVDTNSNLDLLIQTDSNSWIHKLWLAIINDPSATGIEYSMIVSPKKQQELPEVVVKGTGCDGLKFRARMPFSWLIYKLIDRIMRASQDVDKHKEIQELVVRVTDIIENVSLGKVLQKCLSGVKITECIEAYLSDFVHMVYHMTSVEEHQMVCQNLLNGMNMDFPEGLRSVVQNFVAIHALYNKSIPRLENFVSITRVWHECSAKIIEFQQKSSQFYLVTDDELTLDILGLHLLLKSLEPAKDSLNNQGGRQHWQNQVHKYRPVVERILGQFVQGTELSGVEEFGRRCIEGIKAARCQWTRVIAMKLFLQHVCADDVYPVKQCMTFWVMLKNDVDFKDIESLKRVEKFLKLIMKNAVTNAFGRIENCKACESEITERPILLPCEDVICIKCYNDMKISEEGEECPVCLDKIHDHFDPQRYNTQTIKIPKLRMLRRRCNSFFMDLVSQLCFSDDVPPSRPVVEKLMSYITATARSGHRGRVVSKEMSVFEEGIDPTPVLRSFLLQHLLRTSSAEVRRCLEMYLEKVQELMSLKENEEKIEELCLLVIQCLEDSFHQEVTKNTDSEKYKIKMATQLLQRNVVLVMREGLNVEKLYCMAETRFGLIVVGEVLRKLMMEESIKATQNIRRLLEAAGKLCDECGSMQPKLFLIKHLCRCFGLETYQKICKTGDMSMVRWLSVPDLQKNEIVECSDRFIVCGDKYKTVREKLTQAVLSQNMDTLSRAVEGAKLPDFQKRTLVLLAVFREITLSGLYPENRRRVTPAAVELLHQFLEQHPMFAKQVNLLRTLCTNNLWKRNPQLSVQEGMDLGHQNMLCVLNHFFIILLQIPGDRTLIEPLNRLVQQPQDMQRAFLPTMPQDDVAEIKEALLAARRDSDENPVFYRCPNGHPYIIGNCGRPTTVGRCKDCGQEIGGQSYQLRAGNIPDQGLDQTATGHILGRAEGIQPEASPERSMSPIECAVTRLFTHMAMYLGASVNLQAIKNIIKPELEDNNVLPFLWAHMDKDLTTVQRAIGRSVDDVYILLHKICNDITAKHRNVQVTPDVCVLANKNSRRKWEEDFAKLYLSPVFQDMDSYLKTLNKELANDKRLGSDPLLCLLFEIDVPSEDSSPNTIHNVPAVWRYRSQITMDHLLHTIQIQGQTHQVLQMFLQEEHQLRAIRLVPGILKLQRLLIQRFQRKLDRAEATAVTIEDMIQGYENEGKAEEMRSLVAVFSEAWQCVRQHLLTFTFPTLEGLTKIPKEYCQRPITEDQPVSVLLPTFRDAGLCSYGLLYYLLKKQNNFLQEYCKKKKTQYTQLPKVHLTDVTNAHLISYHPNRDILPMVMANCHYTFEVGKGTKIDYSFGDLERQLMDRFLFSKSVIEMPVYEFEMMTYRSETTNAVVFRHLRKKIKQEPLTPAVANQISEEIQAYPDLCETLDKLDITISFLKSVGGESNLSLEKFMTQTLKMENPFPSQKAKSSCVCKHAQSLWITLAMEKTKRQASHKEDAFEGLASDYRVDLCPEQRELIPAFCEEIPLEKLRLLLEMLFECIMLTITVPRETDDDDIDMTKVGLRDTLIGYISARQYDLDLNYPGWMSELVERIPNEGENFTKILNSQAVNVWLCLYAIYTQKESERR